ncbi:MAG: hypothetical protein SGILL_009687, partial [Bacillariaceae sp.]
MSSSQNIMAQDSSSAQRTPPPQQRRRRSQQDEFSYQSGSRNSSNAYPLSGSAATTTPSLSSSRVRQRHQRGRTPPNTRSGATVDGATATPVDGSVRWRGETPRHSNATPSQRSSRGAGGQPPRNSASFDPGFANDDQDDDSQGVASFKGWLFEGMLGMLNTAAGFTISTTGALLSSPIALTRNVVLPGILAIVVEGIDSLTPPRVQDWFRILSSSVYNLYAVLKSTEQGEKFRRQFTLFVQSIFEVWSSAESRQAAVDGMAAAVKLADALHTPEMELFLEQASVLGCRLVDSAASGNTKQLIQNGKSLVWQGIELAVDPSTTSALAEVTAHLCHALEEMDESFHPTPRIARNFQNESTYLSTAQMTEYQSESIESVILSSLGIDYHDASRSFPNDQEYGILTDDNSTASAHSVPSNVNVAFDQDSALNTSQVQIEDRNSRLKERKDKVNVKLLQEQIVSQGRPLARDSTIKPDSAANRDERNPDFGNMEDLEDVPASTTNDAVFLDNHAQLPSNEPDIPDLLDHIEEKRETAEKEPSAVRFYRMVDDLLEQHQEEKQQFLKKVTTNPCQPGSRAKVRSLRDGAPKAKPKSKAVLNQYSNLRR